jgi:hypothetical protein
MNIKQRMKELVEHFKKNKFNGIHVYLRPECESEWHEEYAISQDLYYDDEAAAAFSDNEYQSFDHDRLRSELTNFIDKWFGVEKHRYESSRDKERPVHGELVVRYYWQSQELEIYYEGCKFLRKYKFNLQEKELCPTAVISLAASLDGQSMNLEDAIDLLETSNKDSSTKLNFAVKDNAIIGKVASCKDDGGCPIHTWTLLEFEDVRVASTGE